jgi:hypothetical protein
MKFIDHKANDLFALLGDHTDAVALPQASQKVFFAPGVVMACLLDL